MMPPLTATPSTPSECVQVTDVATAALNATRKIVSAVPSFTRLSPSRIVSGRLGRPNRLPMADAATASVGPRTAAQRQGDGQGQPGDRRLHRDGNRGGREDDQADRQQQDGPTVLADADVRRVESLREQQRGQSDAEDQLGVELQAAGGRRDADGEPGHHQGQRRRAVEMSAHAGHDDRDDHEADQSQGMHCRILAHDTAGRRAGPTCEDRVPRTGGLA